MMPQTAIEQSNLDQLLKVTKMLAEGHIRSEARAKATHARFNVFTTLLSVSDEVRLHTRFLHCLLDPKGCHDCGSLFLRLFFATIEELVPVDHEERQKPLVFSSHTGEWKVSKEASRREYGQIDLLLESSEFGFAIENKIHAAEQEGQLASYAKYLRSKYGDRAFLVYLTLDGKRSADKGASYVRISYADHILSWLDKCLRETYQIIPVNQVILQYREVVRQLTGKNTDIEVMKHVAEFITQHSDIIRYHKQIEAAIEVARADFMDKLAEGIIKHFEPHFRVRLRSNLVQNRFGADANGALIITPPVNSPLHHAPFEIWVLQIHEWVRVMIGIESKYEKPPLSSEHRLLCERMNVILTRYSKARGYHQCSERERSFLPITSWPVGWHDLIQRIDNERLATLLDSKTPLAETVAKVCADITEYIKLLEGVYLEAVSAIPIQAPEISQVTSATPLELPQKN